MAHIDNFQDFIQYHADAVGMTREEYMAVLMSEDNKKPEADTHSEGTTKRTFVKTIESFSIDEKKEDVGKYNTVKKVISKLGRRPSEQELATFINNNYYDVTEVERGEDDPTANDKIADLVGFFKFDIDDWSIAWTDAQNESVVNEARMFYLVGTKEVTRDEMLTYKYDNKDKPVADNGWPKWLYTNNDPKGKTLKWSTIKKDMKDLEKYYGEGNVVVGGRTNAGGPYIEIYSKSQSKKWNESLEEADDTIGNLDHMANTDLERIADYANMIKDRMAEGQELDAWMYHKISDSVSNLNSVHDTMDGTDGVVESVNEEKAKGDRSAIDDDAIETGLKKKATESGVPIALLRLVMRRGMEAWNSSHRPGTTKQQWGYARLNAFLEKGKGTWQGADADIAKEVRDSNKDSKLPIKNPSQYTKKERES
jgi:hypothetical protein